MGINLIQTVTSAQKYYTTTAQWVHDALDRNSSKVDIEDRAKDVLQQLEEYDSRTDKTRYQFGDPLTNRERLLKLIFDLSFRAQPDAIIAAAETLHPEQAAFYSRWQKVCWIQIPTLTAYVLNNALVKIILSVIVLYKSSMACYDAYDVIPALVARSIPFIINNTPLVFFRVTNAALDLKDWTYQNMLIILFFSLASRQILALLPEIPYVMPLARRLSLWPTIFISMVFRSPQTISSFISNTTWSAAQFTWTNCTALANSIKGQANRTRDERLATCKAKAFQVWQTIMIEQEPAL